MQGGDEAVAARGPRKRADHRHLVTGGARSERAL